jgi:pimeloyl-ACP methyl ester carboxylesterase
MRRSPIVRNSVCPVDEKSLISPRPCVCFSHHAIRIRPTWQVKSLTERSITNQGKRIKGYEREWLIVHGYSDGSTSFTGLRDFFQERAGYKTSEIYFIDYTSMDDETTYRDLADKLDTDYRNLFGNERIDVVCHSTGALVVRAWLVLHNERARRRLGEAGDLPPFHYQTLGLNSLAMYS